MNVITYSCGQMLYTDGTTVMSKLNQHFKFDNVISIESNLNIEKYRSIWEENNLTLVNYHKEVKNFKYGNLGLRDMPPLSRDIMEKLSLDRCHLYNMHREERLTFRELDREILDCFQYWNYILDENNIDLFICHGYPHSIYTYSLYAVCKVKGIKFLYLARSCVHGYTYCHDDVFRRYDRLESAYQSALKLDEPYVFSDYMQNEYIQPMENDSYEYKYISKPSGSSTEKPVSKSSKYKQKLSMLLSIRGIRQLVRDKRRAQERKSVPKKTLNYYRKISQGADYTKRFIYVPLQMQPEATTSPMGNVFVDQVLMIKILAYCVKDTDIKIYVKEHPGQAKFFRLSRTRLYDELREIPNVNLIKPDESSFKLQENCVVSATCSGTAIMESLFKYKPVLVFGNRIHNVSPSSLVVSDVESCGAALESILSGKFSIGKKERDAFLYAVEQVCFRGCWFVEHSHLFGISQDEAAENVYNELRDRINEMGYNT